MNALTDLHWPAVIVAAVSAFMLGGLWYGPLFLKPWSRAAGIDPDAGSRHAARTFATAFVLSLLAAIGVAMLLPASADAASGAGFGLLLGTCFVAASFGINYAFSQRPLLLWLIDGGYHVVQFVIYGAILGAWR